MIAAKYAEPRLAHRNLETLIAATIESTLLDVEGLGSDADAAYAVLDELAALARTAYSELVHDTTGFVQYFEASTPVARSEHSTSALVRPLASRPRRFPICVPFLGCSRGVSLA